MTDTHACAHLSLLKRLVIAIDADQDEETVEILREARAELGFAPWPDADDVLEALRDGRNYPDDEGDEDLWGV
jgi:hypothetical protein